MKQKAKKNNNKHKDKVVREKKDCCRKKVIGINVEMNIENSIVIIANAIPNQFGVYL